MSECWSRKGKEKDGFMNIAEKTNGVRMGMFMWNSGGGMCRWWVDKASVVVWCLPGEKQGTQLICKERGNDEVSGLQGVVWIWVRVLD